MTARPALARLQRWMQGVIVHPGPLDEALASAPDPELEAAEVIRPSPSLTGAQRLGVYHGMYLRRMEEALATDYPGLKHFLGDRGFDRLVRDYVQVYPSRSYTLNRLGDHLPEFLRNDTGRRARGFLVDLARLELAVTEAFDERETAPLSEAQVAAVRPEDWERAVLRPIAALRLVRLSWNANAYLDSTKGKRHAHPRPRRAPARVVVFRRAYAVYRLDLEPEAFELLGRLIDGAPLGDAVAAALARRRVREPRLFAWFRDWMKGGLFSAVEASPAGRRSSGGPGRTRTFD